MHSVITTARLQRFELHISALSNINIQGVIEVGPYFFKISDPNCKFGEKGVACITHVEGYRHCIVFLYYDKFKSKLK